MSASIRRAVRALLLLVALCFLGGITVPASAQIPSGDIRIHYHRNDGNYSGWTVYAFDNTTENTGNYAGGPVQASGSDSFGVYFDVGVTSGASLVGIIIHNPTAQGGDQKDPGPNEFVNPSAEGNEYWALSGIAKLYTAQPNLASPTALLPGYIRIHYHRPDSNYSNWTVYAFYDTEEPTGDYNDGPTPVTATDSYGAYFDIKVISSPQNVGIIIHNPSAPGGDQKDPGPNTFVDPTTEGNEFWAYSGIAKLYTSAPSSTNPTALLPGYARIHYYRPDGNYANWTVYAFGDTEEPTNDYNDGTTFQTGSDSYGAYYDIKLIANPSNLGFIVHNVSTGTKDPGPNMYLTQFSNDQGQAWVISGESNVYTTQPTEGQILSSGLSRQQAYWIDRSTVAIPGAEFNSGWTYSLVYSRNATLAVSNNGVLTGASSIPLMPNASGFTSAQAAQYPQLAGYAVFTVPSTVPVTTLKQILTGEIAVVAANTGTGALQFLTGVQDPGVLDDLFYYSGPLGPVFSSSGVSINVWAPTAQSVKLLLYAHEADTTPVQTIPMANANGVWTAQGQKSWKGEYYLYEVVVYVPSQQQIVENIVTDPYSADLALNGTKTRIIDLDEETTKPSGWDTSRSPYLASVSDFSVYELHIRDFSVDDNSVPEEYRGTYLAFTNPSTYGMTHLTRLAEAGLKAVHIMPSFHFASVNEDKSTWQYPVGLSPNPPDGTQQQAAVAAVQSVDPYNWGYDPVHYLAPEGSYAFNPDNRVLEYREMVEGLHKIGLRVVQDVVFNHTTSSGEATNSVLDEIVPGYYYRLDSNGNVENGSCCADTASEHKMFEKLMIDNLVQNAREYKIDGFRFDLMSFHFVYNMQHIQQALSQLTLQNNGVDGSKIYLYGEGWNTGETANDALGINATQANLYGTGIGTFNDRIRDGIRGGGPFSDERVQGFATGLYTDPSLYTSNTAATALSDQLTNLNLEADWIRIGLAGNLRDFTFEDSTGATVKASQVIYGGQPAGYTASPIEDVNYCSVHDNQTLFDAIQLKSAIPGTTSTGGDSSAMRARRQALAMSLVALGQGVPFFLAGDDLLRSKDMDNNSYDSGDWFNKIDWISQADEPFHPGLFAQESDNWGIGLPIASQNQGQWSFMQPLLANPPLTPQPADISTAAAAFQTFLAIRSSSGLFHMATLQEVQNNLHFLNTGPSQIPGLIVMKLDANGGNYGIYNHVVVVFNSTLNTVKFQNDQLKGLGLFLHPYQLLSPDAETRASSINNQTGTATVSGLTTAVFVGLHIPFPLF